jgi:hypothetical protein
VDPLSRQESGKFNASLFSPAALVGIGGMHISSGLVERGAIFLVLAVVIFCISSWARLIYSENAWIRRYIFIYWPLYILWCFALHHWRGEVPSMINLDEPGFTAFFIRCCAGVPGLFLILAWGSGIVDIARAKFGEKEK